MSTEKRDIIASILEESPLFSGLRWEEKRMVIEELLKTYSDFFKYAHKEKVIEDKEEDKVEWFKKRLE
jgi:hypothetical protein